MKPKRKATINPKDLYLHYTTCLEQDIEDYSKKLNRVLDEKNKLYDVLMINIDDIQQLYGINLKKAKLEIVDKTYNDKEYLYQTSLKLLKTGAFDESPLLLQIIKYCNLLRNEKRLHDLIHVSSSKRNITYEEWLDYVNKFYTQVAKCMFSGVGYKFGHRLGILAIINYRNKEPSWMTDFNLTNKKRRELIAQGLKPYNEKEAELYARKGWKYDGVPYKVRVLKTNRLKYILYRTYLDDASCILEYIPDTTYYKLKTSLQEIADKCNTVDDICEFPIGMQYKTSIFTLKFPDKMIQFVSNRDAE